MKTLYCEYCLAEAQIDAKDPITVIDKFWLAHEDCLMFYYVKSVKMKEGQVIDYDNSKQS